MSELISSPISTEQVDKKFIIHVDDEEFMTQFVGELFEDPNYRSRRQGRDFRVLSGKNGLAGCQITLDQYEYEKNQGRITTLQEFFKKFVFAVISDGNMPKMAGPEFMTTMVACSLGIYSPEDLRNLLADPAKRVSILQRKELLDEIIRQRQVQQQSDQKDLIMPVVFNSGGLPNDQLKGELISMESLITARVEKPSGVDPFYKAVGLAA